MSSLPPWGFLAQPIGAMPDPFIALREELRRLVPYGKVAGAAREMQISTSHLHGVLRGDTDAGPEVRQKIAQYVAHHGKPVAAPTKIGLETAEAFTVQSTSPTATAPVTPPAQTSAPEVHVTVPSLIHAACCNLVSSLSLPAVLRLIPQLAKQVEDERAANPSTPPPPDPTPVSKP